MLLSSLSPQSMIYWIAVRMNVTGLFKWWIVACLFFDLSYNYFILIKLSFLMCTVFYTSLSALLLNSIITAFKPEYIAERWVNDVCTTFLQGRECKFALGDFKGRLMLAKMTPLVADELKLFSIRQFSWFYHQFDSTVRFHLIKLIILSFVLIIFQIM